MTTATNAPTANSVHATGCRLMKPDTSACMMEACGAASTARESPGAASPNWKACASMTTARPAAMEPAMTP